MNVGRGRNERNYRHKSKVGLLCVTGVYGVDTLDRKEPKSDLMEAHDKKNGPRDLLRTKDYERHHPFYFTMTIALLIWFLTWFALV